MIKFCSPYFSFFFAVFLIFFTVFSSEASATPERSTAEPKGALIRQYVSAAQDVLLKGLSAVGIRYRKGGTEPESGLDCSGFVQFVFREAAGLVLPRTAKEQALQGEAISSADLKPGDLVFFNTMRRAFSHVGIYLGDSYFLHSPSSGGSVRVESMQNYYWRDRYDGARRILQPMMKGEQGAKDDKRDDKGDGGAKEGGNAPGVNTLNTAASGDAPHGEHAQTDRKEGVKEEA